MNLDTLILSVDGAVLVLVLDGSHGDDKCHRIGPRMSKRNAKVSQTEILRPLCRSPVKHEHWLAALVAEHLHLTPPNAPYARPQGFRRRFLRGETRSELIDAMPISLSFLLRIDAIQESLSKIVQRPLNSRDFDDVGPDGDRAGPFRIEFRDVQHALPLRAAAARL